MTNFEKIQNMNIDEFIDCFRNDNLCKYIRNENFKWCSNRLRCDGCLKDWLNKEVE